MIAPALRPCGDVKWLELQKSTRAGAGHTMRRQIYVLAAVLLHVNAAEASCTKDEILKLIDKGFDKPAIDAVCNAPAGSAQHAPAKANDASSIIVALLDLTKTATLEDTTKLDEQFAGLGLNFTNENDNGERIYEGVLSEVGAPVSIYVGPNYRNLELYDKAPARNTSMKDKYFVALKAAQAFGAKNGLKLADTHEFEYHSPVCSVTDFGQSAKKAKSATGEEMVVKYHLGSVTLRGSCDDGSPKDADSYFDGGFSMSYTWRKP